MALLLEAVALLILLLTCATLASMALAEVGGRRRESAIRLALGAGRAHLIRHQVAWAITVSAAAMAMGLAGGYAMAVGVTAAVVAVGLLLPVRRALRVDPMEALAGE